jgi:hypothetical protein
MTFPLIRGRVSQRQLQLFGAYFDLGTGDLSVYDPTAGKFAPLQKIVTYPISKHGKVSG